MLRTQNLNGEWLLTWTDGQRGREEHALRDSPDPSRFIPASVPGEVHLDLMRAGLIQEPCEGLNVLAARWVEECVWTYRRDFTASREAAGARCWLVFEGLDLSATIHLNGKEVGRHQNVHRPCRIEVSGQLRAGRNTLVVHVEAGLWLTMDKPGSDFINDRRYADSALTKRMWLRKPQCQFGWDWSPRLINVGVTGPVRLEWTRAAARVDQFTPLVSVSPDLGMGSVRARLFVEGLAPKPQPARLAVEIVETGQRVVCDVEVKPGPGVVEAEVEVENPKLWWPHGHGRQPLYTVRAALSVAGRAVGRSEQRIGFRRVVVNQDPHPVKGRFFRFEINNRPVFCKGANYVPPDILFARVDRRRLDKLTGLALEANMNFLRVWGGGFYESDDFYDLCDRKGIMVWQDMAFACTRYPTTDEAFYNECKAEARYNVRRLAPRPSLVAWCGNNECEQGAWEWGWDRKRVLPDYALFHLTLPRICKEEDPGRHYQPSSPFSPDGESPTAEHTGDQHPWSVGFANTDFRDYRRMECRFPNEGGVLGPTSLPTLRACLPKGHETTSSFAWQVHDNSVATWHAPSATDAMIRQWTGRDIRAMSVEEYAYWGGLVQSEGLREYIDNFRRRQFDTSSAVFWMFNDCWPATRSWTVVDYYLRRTPVFAAVKRALAPVSVVVAQEGKDVVMFGVNDTPRPVEGTLRHGLFDLAGRYALDQSAAVRLPANAATPLASFPLSKWKDPRRSAAFATLETADGYVARNRLFLPIAADMRWPRARVRVTLDQGRAVFRSDVFAWGVCLDLDGGRPLADNFFDVYPGQPYSIAWPGKAAPRVLGVGNPGRD